MGDGCIHQGTGNFSAAPILKVFLSPANCQYWVFFLQRDMDENCRVGLGGMWVLHVCGFIED
jgi:hypothetical protein